jgi:serine/threonine-protein kinase
MWLFYVSLEPLVRRWWPQMVIAWNRLVAGDWRDPLVGRDILVGCLIGPIFPMIYFLSMLISRWLDLPYQEPHRFYESMLSGLAVALGSFAWTTLAFNVFITFGLLLVFVILYIILRNVTLATAVFWVLCFLLLASTMANELMVNVIAGVVGATLMVFVLKRFGFLSFFVTSLVGDFFFTFPITTDPSAWYFDVTLLSMSMFAALLLYGFYVSLGGQKLFRGSLIPE